MKTKLTLEKRLTIRPTPRDLEHLDRIAAALRSQGHPYFTRTDAVRHALATVAVACEATASTGAIE